jgi:hypothetical protein
MQPLCHSSSPSPSRLVPEQRWATSHTALTAPLALLVLSSACSGYESTSWRRFGDDEMVGTAPSNAPAFLAEPAACGAYDHPACDVLDGNCQLRLAEIAACQFGGPGTPVVLPPIDTVSRMEYREQLGMSLEMGESVTSAVAFETVVGLLGLTQTGETTAETAVATTGNLVLAFYEPMAERVTLLADARTGNPAADDGLLLHELVHAQQDARYDLDALFTEAATTTDGLFALRSLVEGEASFHEYIFAMGMLGVPSDPNRFRQILNSVRPQPEELMADPAGLWVRSLLLLPYSYGPSWVLERWSESGVAGMPDQYTELPVNSLRMLEAAFGRAPSTSPLWEFPLPNVYSAVGSAPPVEGDEAYPLGVDRMGAWTVYVLALLSGADAAADDLALGWRGDQLDIFELDSGGFAGRFRVGFDSPAHAAEFAALLSKNPNAQVRSRDNLVVVTVSEGEAPEWLSAPL